MEALIPVELGDDGVKLRLQYPTFVFIIEIKRNGKIKQYLCKKENENIECDDGLPISISDLAGALLDYVLFTSKK